MILLARRAGLDGERMQAVAAEGVGQQPVHDAMALDAGLAAEGVRHDIDTEMRLSTFPGAGMPGMKVGFVIHPNLARPQLPRHDFDDPVP